MENSLYKVNHEICVSCWGCLQFCPVSAIIQCDYTADIIQHKCTGCGKCASVCPVEAISKIHYDSAENIELSPYHSFDPEYSNLLSNHDKFDIIVIGGGPSGLSAAYHAAGYGLSVALIERKNTFGVPVACAEGISKTGLEKHFKPKSNWICSEIQGVRLFAPSGKNFLVEHPGAGYVLNRPVMEKDLAGMVEEQGVKIFKNTGLMKIIGDDKVEKIIAKKDGEYVGFDAKYYIGADGVAGLCSRWTHPENILNDDGFNSCAQVLLKSDNIEPDIVEMHWGNEIAPGGYIWIFPKGDSHANVGIGIVPSFANGKSSKAYLDNFLKRKYRDFEIVERRDGLVPMEKRLSPIGRSNMFLVGDTARLTNAISGAGIDSAFYSGKLAAQIIAEMFDSPTEYIHKEYEKCWHDSYGKQLDLYVRIRKGIIRMTDSEFNSIATLIESRLGGRSWHAINIPGFVKDIVFSQPRLLTVVRHFF